MNRHSLKALLIAISLSLIGWLGFANPASAADLIFWNDLENGRIMSMPLDGSSAPSAVDIAPAEVNGNGELSATGSLDYDPDTGRLYWPNSGAPVNISWASADGSGGGVLPGSVADPIDPPYQLSLDGPGRKLFVVGGEDQSVATYSLAGQQESWPLNNDNFRIGVLADAQAGRLWVAGPEWINYGNLDGTGSLETLNPVSYDAFMNGGFSFDRDSDRLYGTWWIGDPYEAGLPWAEADGSEDGAIFPGEVDVAGASSTAIDHDTGTLYWINAFPFDELAESRGLFRVSQAGGNGSRVGDAPVGARAGGLVILKEPLSRSAPILSGGTTTGSELACGSVEWVGDRPEAHYFRSPDAIAVAWTLDGKAITGNSETLEAEQAGTYRCIRRGMNAAGSTDAASNELVVTDPTPAPPVCPTIKLTIGVSRFAPPKPFGRVNAPGVRVTLKSSRKLKVELRPEIAYRGKNKRLSARLHRHRVTVNGSRRLRFLLPARLKKAIRAEREIRLAPVSFKSQAEVWQPGERKCAQKHQLKLNTKVRFVSKRPGIGLRRLW